MNYVTLVIELEDDEVHELPDVVAMPNVKSWAWGNAIDDAAKLRGTVIDLLNAQKEFIDANS